jgi:hypothetical protein
VASLTPAARNVLARLELLQHGTTTNYDPAKGSRNSEPTIFPPGETSPPHERWRAAMEAAEQRDLGLVVQRAADDLLGATRRPLAPVLAETMGELVARIMACDGFDPREVALSLRCTERLVRTTRVQGGRHAENGHALKACHNADDDVARARELVAGGMTLRQAGAILGVAHTTVARWLA